MRMRGLPPALRSPGSTATSAIGALPRATKLASVSALTLRKSIYKVSGSGRVATYGTGSLASITTDMPVVVERDVIVFSRMADGVAVVALLDSPLDAAASPPASATATTT